MVPYGYLIIPDISCSTSFSSSISETTYEFFNSLKGSVNVGIQIPMFSFKASFKYKETSSFLSSGEFVYITSRAKCRYYFAQLDIDNPPEFSPGFLHWTTMLSESNEKKIYMDFLDKFGTHFSTSLVFGAEYVYEHKMESSKFKEEPQKGVDIKASASFFGTASVICSLDTSQRESATKFNKMVSTETLTNSAAPPANGDALTWASTVKENPVPIKYKLAPIADLFTEEYMSSLNIKYEFVLSNLKNYSTEYCRYLQNDGYVDSCEDDDGEIELSSTRLWTHYSEKQVEGLHQCISHCKERLDCYAISYLKQEKFAKGTFTCYLYNHDSDGVYGTFDHNWETVIFQQPRDSSVLFTRKNTNIGGQIQGDAPKTMSKDVCKKSCTARVTCTGFSICECAECKCASRKHTCKLFGQGKMNHFYKDDETNSYVLLSRVDRGIDIY